MELDYIIDYIYIDKILLLRMVIFLKVGNLLLFD